MNSRCFILLKEGGRLNDPLQIHIACSEFLCPQIDNNNREETNKMIETKIFTNHVTVIPTTTKQETGKLIGIAIDE